MKNVNEMKNVKNKKGRQLVSARSCYNKSKHLSQKSTKRAKDKCEKKRIKTANETLTTKCWRSFNIARERFLLIMQILRQCRRKTTNTAPTTLSAIQAASQSNFINYTSNNYTQLVISWNDKNKQPTLLSQRKLACTVRNTLFFCVIKSLEQQKN